MASVLKSNTIGTPGSLPSPVAFNMEDVQSRAKQYLLEVQEEAQKIMAQAQQDAVKIRVEAKQQGLADAQQELTKLIQERAQQISDERCRTAVGSCENTISKLTKDTAQWLAGWRDRTVEIASKMAEKIVRRQMNDDGELLRVWLEESIVAMCDARGVRVKVHPDDFAVAGRFLQNLAKSVPLAADVEVVPDPEIQPGGCIVASDHGQIDQQLETQLARLVEQLS